MLIRKIDVLGRTYRHAQRYREIVSILFRHGFDDLLTRLKPEDNLPVGIATLMRKRTQDLDKFSTAERARMAMEDLGPTFVKMGQILATRPDFLPPEFIAEMGRLQDDVPPFPINDVREIIETDLERPLEELFPHFDEQPLAAASIGQVHRARLPLGEEVVVKIQRPGIQRRVEADLEIILHIASLLEKHVEGWDIHQPTRIVEEFAATLEKELDYQVEASHTDRFAAAFNDDPHVYVPHIYREASGTRVLTMEFIQGIKSDDVVTQREQGLDPTVVAASGADAIMKQIFEDGFFHADPHPGNIFVLSNNLICFIDFGMMGRITRDSREQFVDLLMAIVERDEIKATDALLQLAEYDTDPDMTRFQRDVAEFMGLHLYRPLKEIELGKILQQILELASKHRLRIPPDLFLMMKALGTIEGLGRTLDPDFDVVERAKPFVKRIQMNRLNPKRVAGDLYRSGTQFARLFKELPRDLHKFLDMTQRGKVKVEIALPELPRLIASNERVSNRIAFALVLAALVVGSALIVLSRVPPSWHDIPIIGLAGFSISGFMGLCLLISMVRHGRL